MNKIPPPPPAPLARILRDDRGTFCKKCGSSTAPKNWWNPFGELFCINPECGGYHNET